MARLEFAGISSIEGHMLLPKGVYGFEIDKADPEYKSKEKGSRALELAVHVIEGPDFDDGTSTVGMERHMRLWFPTPTQTDGGNSCARRFIEIANAAGVPGVSFNKEMKTVEIEETEEFIGKRFACTVAYQDYKGENQEDYKSYKKYE